MISYTVASASVISTSRDAGDRRNTLTPMLIAGSSIESDGNTLEVFAPVAAWSKLR